MGAPEGQGPGATRGVDGTEPSSPIPGARTADASWFPLWVWPTLATVGVAATSQVAGAWWAAILVIVLVGGAAANLLAMRPGQPIRWAVAIAVAGGVLAVGAVILATDAIQSLASARPPLPSTDGVSLRGKDLRGADYDGASLARADLRGADLSGANLSGADLTGAHLDGAILRGANLQDACLRHTDMTGAILDGADFTGADVRDASIAPSENVRPGTWPPIPSVLVECRG